MNFSCLGPPGEGNLRGMTSQHVSGWGSSKE